MKSKRYRVTLEFSEEQYGQVDKLRKETRLSLSSLVCHILLQKKVDLHVRNRSMDECMEELIILRRRLEDDARETGPGATDMIARIQEQIRKLSELWLQ
jgi:hypothetical protein